MSSCERHICEPENAGRTFVNHIIANLTLVIPYFMDRRCRIRHEDVFMVCIREMSCEIVGRNLTPETALNIVSSLSDEVYLVPGGYHLGELILTGTMPAPVGISGNDVYFRFIKPCFGIFVMKLAGGRKEAEDLRTAYYLGRYGGRSFSGKTAESAFPGKAAGSAFSGKTTGSPEETDPSYIRRIK